MTQNKHEEQVSPVATEEQAMKDSKQNDATETTQSAAAASPAPARRKLLSTGMVGAAAAMLGIVAAACSSDDDPTTTTTGGGGAGGKGAGGKGGAGAPGKAGASTGGSSGGEAVAGAGGAAEAGANNAGAAGAVEAAPDADIAPLNALLSAEYNAITAYTAGAGLIGAAKAADPLYALREVITDVAVSIQAQHKLHAAALVDSIQALKGTPVEEADIAAKFKAPTALTGNPTISNVLKFAASAERGAAVAYNQVLAGLEDAQLRFLASAIEGDETQHFIVLAALVLGLAAPGPNLSTTTADKVIPEPFVSTVGTKGGLDKAPPDYFA